MKTLKTVIDFVATRADMTVREDILREINYAWGEIWDSDDLPNSCFELTAKQEISNPRISLPWYVGKIRAVKTVVSHQRIKLYTPRPYYQDDTYRNTPYSWRILGEVPLSRSIENATRLTFTLASVNTKQFKISVIGSDDNASEVRDQIIFPVGVSSIASTRQFTDATSIVKDTIIEQDVNILGANGENYGVIPNLSYQAHNTIVQIVDKCCVCITGCNCYDIYYKRVAPVLYYDEQMVSYPEVLMMKTLEWITLPKDGQEQKAAMYGGKSQSLQAGFNRDDSGVSHVLDVSANRLYSSYGSDL